MGVAWYRREEWPKLLTAAADRDLLEGKIAMNTTNDPTMNPAELTRRGWLRTMASMAIASDDFLAARTLRLGRTAQRATRSYPR